MDKKSEKLDLAIIGAGPAGLSASIYASRYQIKHIVVSGGEPSQLSEAHLIENYPGFISISGRELIAKFKEQAEKFGGNFILGEVRAIRKTADGFQVFVGGDTYEVKAIILAVGMKRRQLQIKGEKELLGKGVSYCAVCDAAFFKDKTVAVIGGSNSAAMAAVHLAEFAQKIYQIYRKNKLRSEPTWTDRVLKNPKIELIYNTNIIEIKGTRRVEGVVLDKPFKGEKELKLDGVFIEIGFVPQVALAKDLELELDELGYIRVGPDQATNVAGVYAAGDVTTNSNRLSQVITASSEGAVAATSVFSYLNK